MTIHWALVLVLTVLLAVPLLTVLRTRMLLFLGLRNGESSNSSKESILTTLQTEGLIYFKAPFDAGYRRSWACWLTFGGIAYVMRGGTYAA